MRMLLHFFHILLVVGLGDDIVAAFSVSSFQRPKYLNTKSWSILSMNTIPPPGQRPPPQGGDMAYIRENIMRQMNHYTSIREVGGLDSVNDIYVRDPESTTWWYVGKVSRCTGTVSLSQAVQRQWNLIEEHATRLRPVELGRSFGQLQVWAAAGDSELEISNNNENYPMEQIIRMDTKKNLHNTIKNIEVGFNCEVVTNKGEGFRVQRTDTGEPLLS